MLQNVVSDGSTLPRLVGLSGHQIYHQNLLNNLM